MKIWQKTLALILGLTLLAGSWFPPAVQALPADTESRLSPRWTPSKPVHTKINVSQSRAVIELKFVEGTTYRLDGGRMTVQDREDLVGLQSVLDSFRVRHMERLFSQPEADISAEHDALQAASRKDLPDLNLWFRVRVPDGADPEALIDALNALKEVEIAYPAALPAPPPSYPGEAVQAAPLPVSPSYVDNQGYLDPATQGIDAEFARTLAGGTGANVTIVDIEYNYNTSHEDLPAVTLIGGAMWDYYGNNHGTAVLGELGGANNSIGVTGIAHAADFMFSASCTSIDPANPSFCDLNIAEAINTARTNTDPGDVILLEAQTPVCGGSDEDFYGPVEWVQATFDAIQVATAANRIVIEAAGNGGVDLDGDACNDLFDRSERDSGAIIVGAGATIPRPTVRAWISPLTAAGWTCRAGARRYTRLGTATCTPDRDRTSGTLRSSAALHPLRQ